MDLLINWICQGSALTVLVWMAVGMSPSISAATRGTVWWLTHAIVLMMGVLTLGVLPIETFTGAGRPLERAAANFPSVHPVLTLPETTAWPLTILLLIWAVWIMVSIAKVLVALVYLLRLKTSVVAVSSDREARLSTWATLKHSGRRAQLATSPRLSTPAVLGLGSSVIVLPAWMIDSLSDQALDQVVAHEWAHVQRHDDLAILAQALIRAVAGLHPAVWWIDRSISIERELACDDWAVSVTGSVKRYAGSLVMLAGLRVSREPVTLAPAILSVRRAHLTRRIERLLDPRRNASARRSPLALAVGGPVLLAAGLVMATLEPVRTASVMAAPIEAVRLLAPVIHLGLVPAFTGNVRSDRVAAGPSARRVRRLDREVSPITAIRHPTLDGSREFAPPAHGPCSVGARDVGWSKSEGAGSDCRRRA